MFDKITRGTHMYRGKRWRPAQITQISQSRPIKPVAHDDSVVLKLDGSMHLDTNRLLSIDQNIDKNLYQPASECSGLSDREAEDPESQKHPRIHDRPRYSYHGRFQRNLFRVDVSRPIGIKMLRGNGLPIALAAKISAVAVDKPP